MNPLVVSEFQQNEPGLFGEMGDPRSGAGNVQDKCGFRSTFYKIPQVPFGTSSSSFTREYRTRRTACQQGRGRSDNSGIKEWDQMSGYSDAVVHHPGILVKSEILTPLAVWSVGCSQCTPESFSGNCFQWRKAALLKITPLFRGQSCLNWDHSKGPSQLLRKSY